MAEGTQLYPAVDWAEDDAQVSIRTQAGSKIDPAHPGS